MKDGCVCPWMTRLHIDRCLCSADLCRSVSHSTLDTSRRGFSPLQGSAPWQARSHGRASSQRIGYIRFAALPASKICLKISASKLGGGLAHYVCHASNTASQRVRFAYPFAFPHTFFTLVTHLHDTDLGRRLVGMASCDWST